MLDKATGLNYMQQRYYDPGIGRFLSVDPVSTNASTGGNFSRYWYANNNPYRFTDPDGRYVCDGSVSGCKAFDQGLADVKKAAGAYAKNSPEGKAFARIVNFYGKAWSDNGVTVKVVSQAASASGGSAKLENGRSTITINLDASRTVARGNAALFRADVAGTVAHEGNHGQEHLRLGMPLTENQERWAEKRAALTEAWTFKGLNIDATWGTWTKAGGISSAAIQLEAEASTAAWCQQKQGGCP